MNVSQIKEQEIALAVKPLGLFSFGWFQIQEGNYQGCSAILIGNRAEDGEHPMFEVLRTTSEINDGNPDPLNRWTKRVMDKVAGEQGATALYPFGDVVWPFQQFANLAIGTKASPLGLLIHPEYGLWHAFRSVLVFDEVFDIEAPAPVEHPCDSCETKPCLNNCPVSAFSATGLDVASCFSHIDSDSDPKCLTIGCQARAACPVGVPYSDEQIRFHMKAYRGV